MEIRKCNDGWLETSGWHPYAWFDLLCWVNFQGKLRPYYRAHVSRARSLHGLVTYELVTIKLRGNSRMSRATQCITPNAHDVGVKYSDDKIQEALDDIWPSRLLKRIICLHPFTFQKRQTHREFFVKSHTSFAWSVSYYFICCNMNLSIWINTTLNWSLTLSITDNLTVSERLTSRIFWIIVLQMPTIYLSESIFCTDKIHSTNKIYLAQSIRSSDRFPGILVCSYNTNWIHRR